MRTRWFGFVAALAFCFATLPVFADKRVALVIGNGSYEHVDRLANPVTDARNLRDALTEMGFEVVYGENLNKRSLEHAIGRFAKTAGGADVALTYFAGHGATFGDTPYVVPVDAHFSTLEGMPYELVPVETLIGELRRVKGVRVAILDACRDNTAERELKRVNTRGGEISRGLARVKDPDGLIIAYATQHLSTTEDGDPNGDSPFTAALLNSIFTPGLDIKEMFYKVAREVTTKTEGRQRPEVSISFYDSYALVEPAPETGAVQSSPARIGLSESTPTSPALMKRFEAADQAKLSEETKDETVISRPTSANQSCARRPHPNAGIVYCASSVLPSQFGNLYGVQNLFGAASSAWVAGSRGYAIGEWIVVEFDEKRTVASITILNGYQKNSDIFFKNSRVKRLDIVASSGAKSQFTLEDRLGAQQLSFDNPFQAKWIALIIRDVFPGNKYTDTAISKLDVHYSTN